MLFAGKHQQHTPICSGESAISDLMGNAFYAIKKKAGPLYAPSSAP